MRVVCTTPWKASAAARRRADETAAWFACPRVPRRNRSIETLLAEERADGVIVAEEMPVLYHAECPDRPLFFHPGMAKTRIAAIRKGSADRLLRLAGIRPGDVVFDGTLGLGTDSLVFAYAVGESGRVIAAESSWWLARLFQYAQGHGTTQPDWWRELLMRIEVHAAGHADLLKQLPDESVDVVYFDPMFRRPVHAPTQVDPLRPWANPEPLAEDTIAEARRVARRCVIVKERPLSGEFERLGLTPDKPRGTFAYGIWCKG
jgi:16S rRNA (guanine1516-N2)-methyltransferase